MNMMMCTDCGNINNKAHVSTNEGKINKIHKKLSSEEDISHFIPHLEKLLLRHIHNTWHLGTSNKKLTPHTFNFFNKNQRIKVKERERKNFNHPQGHNNHKLPISPPMFSFSIVAPQQPLSYTQHINTNRNKKLSLLLFNIICLFYVSFF
jgi:hypothetical protein